MAINSAYLRAYEAQGFLLPFNRLEHNLKTTPILSCMQPVRARALANLQFQVSPRRTRLGVGFEHAEAA